MKGISITIAILVLSMSNVISQDLEHHAWKDRILILFQMDQDKEAIDLQVNELISHTSGLKERKLVVYQVRSDKWKIGLEHDSKWKPLSNNIFERYRSDSDQNEIILVGLDGGIKLRNREFMACQELFAIIDGMPMRRTELRSKQKN